MEASPFEVPKRCSGSGTLGDPHNAAVCRPLQAEGLDISYASFDDRLNNVAYDLHCKGLTTLGNRIASLPTRRAISNCPIKTSLASGQDKDKASSPKPQELFLMRFASEATWLKKKQATVTCASPTNCVVHNIRQRGKKNAKAASALPSHLLRNAHARFIAVLPPHSSPYCLSPSFVRETSVHCEGSPGTLLASPGTKGLEPDGSSMLPAQAPKPQEFSCKGLITPAHQIAPTLEALRAISNCPVTHEAYARDNFACKHKWATRRPSLQPQTKRPLKLTDLANRGSSSFLTSNAGSTNELAHCLARFGQTLPSPTTGTPIGSTMTPSSSSSSARWNSGTFSPEAHCQLQTRNGPSGSLFQELGHQVTALRAGQGRKSLHDASRTVPERPGGRGNHRSSPC